MIAVSPATATATTRPPQPCRRQRHRHHERREDQDENKPVGIADPLDKLKHGLIARPTRQTDARARNLIPRRAQPKIRARAARPCPVRARPTASQRTIVLNTGTARLLLRRPRGSLAKTAPSRGERQQRRRNRCVRRWAAADGRPRRRGRHPCARALAATSSSVSRTECCSRVRRRAALDGRANRALCRPLARRLCDGERSGGGCRDRLSLRIRRPGRPTGGRPVRLGGRFVSCAVRLAGHGCRAARWHP